MASVYWLLVKETGWTYPEVDELLLTDFYEIAEQWVKGTNVESGEETETTSAPVVPREVSEEEWKRICAAEQGFAEKRGGPRNPFL